MKTNLIAVLIFISTSVFAQTQSKTALYTFSGKPCTGTIIFTEEEFAKGNKLFLPISAGDKIISFVASVLVNGTFVDFTVHGNNQDFIKTISPMKSGGKLLIGQVKMLHENKTITAPSVVIQIN